MELMSSMGSSLLTRESLLSALVQPDVTEYLRWSSLQLSSNYGASSVEDVVQDLADMAASRCSSTVAKGLHKRETSLRRSSLCR